MTREQWNEHPILGFTEMRHFPGYYVNETNWLYKLVAGQMKPMKPTFPYPLCKGTRPFFKFQFKGKKVVIFPDDLIINGYAEKGKL